jgi:hypothetical protein
MIEMFLRSAGAPPRMLEIYRLIQAEGLSAVNFQPMAKDDANWKRIGADPETSYGLWLRAEGKTSRLTAAVFFEGVNDETAKALAGFAGVPALTDGSDLP